jgi:hypothetical protein
VSIPRGVPLYELLPVIYRSRDVQLENARHDLAATFPEVAGAEFRQRDVPPLEALFALFQSQFDLLQADIAALYEDWFVETCRPEMLSLLAEPLAIDDLTSLARGGADLRSIVANMVGYRQAKGTAGAFESFAHDATGWNVRVVDEMRSRATTARVDKGLGVRGGFVDVRRAAGSGAPADRAARGYDVRAARGVVRTVEVEVWRTAAARVSGVEPGRPDPGDGRRRTFSPAGDDKALMCASAPGAGAHEQWVPLTRVDARSALALTGAIPDLAVRARGWLGESSPPLQIADLADWTAPASARAQTVFVDPELGRLLVPHDHREYTVDYGLLTFGGIGAQPPSRPWPGTADRTILVSAVRGTHASLRVRRLEAQLLTRVIDDAKALFEHRFTLFTLFEEFAGPWSFLEEYIDRFGEVPSRQRFLQYWPTFAFTSSRASVVELMSELARERSRETSAREGFERAPSLAAALREAQDARGSVRIVLGDSATYRRFFGRWDFVPGPHCTGLAIESAPGMRPTLSGSLYLSALSERVQIDLRGLNVHGSIVCSGNLALAVELATLRPGDDGPSLETAGDQPIAIAVRSSLLGGARVGANVELQLEDTIVTDPIQPAAAGTPGCALTARRATTLGEVEVDRLFASDVLFDRPVQVTAPYLGWARYCVIRPGSQIPPDFGTVNTDRPLLASTRYGRPRFARLRDDAPASVVSGGSVGSEIGAYAQYAAGYRAANLARAMAEFLPEGVAARVRYKS